VEGEPEATASAEVVVEVPFHLSCRCSNLPQMASLILDTDADGSLLAVEPPPPRPLPHHRAPEELTSNLLQMAYLAADSNGCGIS